MDGLDGWEIVKLSILLCLKTFPTSPFFSGEGFSRFLKRG